MTGFPAFNVAECMTNFVVTPSHLKNTSLTHVSFYRQLQTSWLDLLRQLWLISLHWSYKFYLSIITSNNVSKENNQIINFYEIAVDEGDVGWGGKGADKRIRLFE